MNFIKRHYEKILLGAVLLGLAVAAAWLPLKISGERQQLIDLTTSILVTKPKPLPALDSSRLDTSDDRLNKPVPYDYSAGHNLFNPVPWQKAADGKMIKVAMGNEIGPDKLVVLKMNPLYTTVAYESLGESDSNFLISVTRDADLNPRLRGKKSFDLTVGVKGELMTLDKATVVKGTADQPDQPQLMLEMNDTGQKFTIFTDHPFMRVDGYSTDVKYDPEKRMWQNRRVGDRLFFAGDEFTIVAIQQNPVATNQFEVVVSAKSTGKKTTIEFSSQNSP